MGREQQEQKFGLLPWSSSLLNNPNRNFTSLFPSILEEMASGLGELSSQRGLSISEDKKNVYVEAPLPGLKPDQIEVNLERGILTIQGKKHEEEEDKERKYYCRTASEFSYRTVLPNNIDESKEPKAIYKDGIMKITFMKSQQTQGKKIAVKGS